jgi:hypothetical protein
MLSRKASEQNRDYCERMAKIWRRFQISFFIVAVLCLAWLFLLPVFMNRPNMFLASTRDYMFCTLVIVAVLNLASTEIVIRYFRKQMKEEK